MTTEQFGHNPEPHPAHDEAFASMALRLYAVAATFRGDSPADDVDSELLGVIVEAGLSDTDDAPLYPAETITEVCEQLAKTLDSPHHRKVLFKQARQTGGTHA